MVSPERFDQEAAASTRVSPESCGLPSVISWTLIENNSHSTAKTVHIQYDGASFFIKCGFLSQKRIGTS